MSGKQERNYAIELLRVISMMGIVLLHVQSKTGWLTQHQVRQASWLGSWGIHAFCIAAVNVYVLISGYFMPGSKRSTKKVFSLWGTAVTWGMLILMLNICVDRSSVSPKDFLGVLLPISTRQYWFLTVYIALYLISPYLDILLKTVTKKQYQGLLVILVVLFSLLPTFIPYGGEDGITGINGIGGTNIAWFCVLYAIAGYIRRFMSLDEIRINRYKYLAMNVAATAIMLVFQLSMEAVQNQFGFGGSYGVWFFNYASLINLMASIGMFLFFLSLNVQLGKSSKRMLMLFSQGTFSVYLIHENVKMRPLLWDMVKQIDAEYLASMNYTFKIMLISACIFVVCCLMEYCRKMAVSRLLRMRPVKIFDRIDHIIYFDEKV